MKKLNELTQELVASLVNICSNTGHMMAIDSTTTHIVWSEVRETTGNYIDNGKDNQGLLIDIDLYMLNNAEGKAILSNLEEMLNNIKLPYELASVQLDEGNRNTMIHYTWEVECFG